VAEVAGAITPVPGGVGKMTIAMLLMNTLQAARAGGKADGRKGGQ
jgi:methylenetetrahydrofolate dehydrogenase (NADP+)/methenyltetrahydrofolate cyclohydrolase